MVDIFSRRESVVFLVLAQKLCQYFVESLNKYKGWTGPHVLGN